MMSAGSSAVKSLLSMCTWAVVMRDGSGDFSWDLSGGFGFYMCERERGIMRTRTSRDCTALSFRFSIQNAHVASQWLPSFVASGRIRSSSSSFSTGPSSPS